MSLDKHTKEEITKKFQIHERDTGSADVQIALLTERIKEYEEHLGRYPDDNATRLCLIKCVGTRRRLLVFLHSTATERYHMLIKRLGLKK